MNQKEREETHTILMMANFIEKECLRIFTAYEFQIESLKIENKQLRDSLAKVESNSYEDLKAV